MSSCTYAKLVVGLPFTEVCKNFKEYDQLSNNPEFLQSTTLDIVMPYYDAALSDCLIGFTLVSSEAFAYREINESISITKSKELFELITGKKAKFYLTPYIE